MRDYIELTKPRITWLILMSTGIGYFFGLPSRANWWEFLRSVPLLSLLHTIIGTGLLASGTAALNQWYEREADRKMRRTAMRPLPSGRMTATSALVFGVALSVAGFVDLWLGVNLLAGLIGAFTLASYLFLYTPMKQRTWWSTTVGAIPGAMPPLIGYAAAAGAITREALGAGRDPVPLAVPAFLLHRLDVQGRLRARRHPHAAGGGAGWPLHGAPDRAVRPGADPGEPDARYCWECPGASIWWERCLLGLWFLYSGVRVALERTPSRARNVLLTSVIVPAADLRAYAPG